MFRGLQNQIFTMKADGVKKFMLPCCEKLAIKKSSHEAVIRKEEKEYTKYL
jgi:hypothetical protein